MRYTKTLGLMLLMAASATNVSFAQEEDPLAAIDELNEAIEALESFEEDNESFETNEESSVESDFLSPTEIQDNVVEPNSSEDLMMPSETLDATENTVESENVDSQNIVSETVNELQSKSITDRLQIKEIPEGKENHLLYTMPGTIDYRGMTFMRIDSSKFFNRFQKCNIAESDTVTSTLSRLKVSQGAPLECRESMKYQFLPYRTFRASR